MIAGYDDAESFASLRQARVERTLMRRFGWFSSFIPDDPTSPTGFNMHTRGFEESWGHPDIQIVVPLPPEVAQGILNRVAVLVKGGEIFEPDHEYKEILLDYTVRFAWAREGDRRVLRIILPDAENRTAREEIAEPHARQWEGTE